MEPAVAPHPAPGEHIEGRYRLLRRRPDRGAAAVFEAEDERLQRRVEVRVLDDSTDLASLDGTHSGPILDAGDHEGKAFVVVPLRGAAPVVGTGTGDDEPTQEVAIPADHTAVLPLPLVPEPPPVADPGPRRANAVVRTVAGSLWARRALLVAVVGVVLLLLVSLAAGDDLEVPSETTVPVTAATSTTLAPTTTTSPPTTEAPRAENPPKGKGKRGKD